MAPNGSMTGDKLKMIWKWSWPIRVLPQYFFWAGWGKIPPPQKKISVRIVPAEIYTGQLVKGSRTRACSVMNVKYTYKLSSWLWVPTLWQRVLWVGADAILNTQPLFLLNDACNLTWVFSCQLRLVLTVLYRGIHSIIRTGDTNICISGNIWSVICFLLVQHSPTMHEIREPY
jgi:hypothetical protein